MITISNQDCREVINFGELIKKSESFKKTNSYWYKDAKFFLSIHNVIFFGYFDGFNCFHGCSAGELLRHGDNAVTLNFRLSAKEFNINKFV
jgi:hypothetical protein